MESVCATGGPILLAMSVVSKGEKQGTRMQEPPSAGQSHACAEVIQIGLADSPSRHCASASRTEVVPVRAGPGFTVAVTALGQGGPISGPSFTSSRAPLP